MNSPTTLKEWQLLQTHQQTMGHQSIACEFTKNPNRFNQLSLSVGEILLDYSKNQITPETLPLLCQLADACNLKSKMAALFSGAPINHTEKRPVLHTALRNLGKSELNVNQHNIMQDIHHTLKKMHAFTDQVRNQTWRGCTGKPITDIVTVGIGGSHLGPQMAVQALSEYATDKLRCHFISNIDSAHLDEVLNQINPDTSLFILSSKTFSTIETLTNAKTIRDWMSQKLPSLDLTKHFVAITANPKKAQELDIPEQQIFTLWEWVGGRYSVWSAIGLPLALMIGMPNFLKFLEGAHAMDQHFQTAALSENMPVIMALLGIWYINFFGATSHAIIPYAHSLSYLPAYLQQADMESNGKCTTQMGKNADYSTGPILWGEQGINGQHAFYQLLHQGGHLTPIDFILVAESSKNFKHQHDILIASGLSQSQALMCGKSTDEIIAELLAAGSSEAEANLLAPHKTIPGNRPNNVLFIKKITPFNLGSLLALYEHKIFVQGVIWNINSFDQWGVELGKQLLPTILSDLKNSQTNTTYDASTLGLINHYKKNRAQ